MRKHRLVVEAAEGTGVSNVLCGRIVRTLLEGIVLEVADGAEVRLGLFGTYECVDLPPEGGRRRLKREVRFKPGKRFRDALHP